MGFPMGFPIVFPWNGGGIPDADATVGIAREDGLVDGWMDGYQLVT